MTNKKCHYVKNNCFVVLLLQWQAQLAQISSEHYWWLSLSGGIIAVV